PGSGSLQDLAIDGKSITTRIGEWARELGHRGERGFADVGLVVGATYPDELRRLRAQFPELWFLIPGFGAQGAKAEDVRDGFDSRGLGAIVSSSRGVLFAYEGIGGAWESAIERAARQTRDSINRALGSK